jgi:hypothetical protein
MPSKPKPLCQSVRTWLANRNGRHALGVFTGGTSRVFSAYIHLVEVWVHTRSDESVAALRATVAMLQRSELKLAAEAIAHAGDWGHIDELWPEIKPAGTCDYKYIPQIDRVVDVIVASDKVCQ